MAEKTCLMLGKGGPSPWEQELRSVVDGGVEVGIRGCGFQVHLIAA